MSDHVQALRDRIKPALGEDWEAGETMTEAILRLRKKQTAPKRFAVHHWYPEEQDPDGETFGRWRCSGCQDSRYSVNAPTADPCPGLAALEEQPRCENPECDRGVPRGTIYCCAACAHAAAEKRPIHSHSRSCDERQEVQR